MHSFSKSLLAHPLLQPLALIKLLSAAGLGLTVVTVMGIAGAFDPTAADSAYAQSSLVATSPSSSRNTAASTSRSSAAGSTSANSKTTPGTTASQATTTTTTKAGSTSGTAATSSGVATTTPSTPAPTPAPAAAPVGTWKYPLHTGIKTTYFWAGEAASADNDFIQNVSSAWQTNWAGYFGGEDNPYSRCGYNPCAFTPKENPFYFALPYGDFTETGPVADLNKVYWYDAAAQATINSGQSILKNRWIQITAAPTGTSKTVYAQWQDVGPFESHDTNYVFGTASPASTRAGLDVSPAVRDYLGMGGSTTSSWRFVDYSEVPAGPWKTIVTTSGTDWN